MELMRDASGIFQDLLDPSEKQRLKECTKSTEAEPQVIRSIDTYLDAAGRVSRAMRDVSVIEKLPQVEPALKEALRLIENSLPGINTFKIMQFKMQLQLYAVQNRSNRFFTFYGVTLNS